MKPFEGKLQEFEAEQYKPPTESVISFWYISFHTHFKSPLYFQGRNRLIDRFKTVHCGAYIRKLPPLRNEARKQSCQQCFNFLGAHPLKSGTHADAEEASYILSSHAERFDEEKPNFQKVESSAQGAYIHSLLLSPLWRRQDSLYWKAGWMHELVAELGEFWSKLQTVEAQFFVDQKLLSDFLVDKMEAGTTDTHKANHGIGNLC